MRLRIRKTERGKTWEELKMMAYQLKANLVIGIVTGFLIFFVMTRNLRGLTAVLILLAGWEAAYRIREKKRNLAGCCWIIADLLIAFTAAYGIWFIL